MPPRANGGTRDYVEACECLGFQPVQAVHKAYDIQPDLAQRLGACHPPGLHQRPVHIGPDHNRGKKQHFPSVRNLKLPPFSLNKSHEIHTL